MGIPSVCPSVDLSLTLVDHIQTAGWIEMPFGVGTCGDPRHIVLDGVRIAPRVGGWGGDVWRIVNSAQTIALIN